MLNKSLSSLAEQKPNRAPSMFFTKPIMVLSAVVGAISWGVGASFATQQGFQTSSSFWIGVASFVGGVALNLIVVGFWLGKFKQWQLQVDSERAERGPLIERLTEVEVNVEHHKEVIKEIKEEIVDEIRSVRTDLIQTVANMKPIIIDRRENPR